MPSAQKTQDDLLDSILETTPEEGDGYDSVTDPDAGETRDETEGEPEAAAAESDAQAPEPEPEAEAQGEAEPETEPERVDDGGAAVTDSGSAEPAAEAAPDERTPDQKRADGLQREVKKLREKLRNQAAQPVAPVAPQYVPQQPIAPAPGQTTAPAPGASIPVIVSDDGQNVSVDPAALEAFVTQRSQQMVHQALQPTPQQIQSQRLEIAETAFVNEAPEVNRPAVERSRQVDNLITAHVEGLIQTGRIDIRQPVDMNHVIAMLTDDGVPAQIAEFVPEIGTTIGFGEFVAGQASGDPNIINGIHRRLATQPGRVEIETLEQDGLKSVKDGPKSMARKGGERSAAPTEDKNEFADLQKKMTKDPVFGLTDKEVARMNDLGDKLGIEGFGKD